MALVKLHYVDILDSMFMRVTCELENGGGEEALDVCNVELCLEGGQDSMPTLKLTLDAADFNLVKVEPEKWDEFEKSLKELPHI